MIEEYPYMEIGEGIYEINEFDNVSMFLIVGDEKALLVDTGIGIGNIKTFAEKLAGKPVEVFLTHNHRDHVGNAPLFPKVHISRIDYGMGKMIRPLTSRESRRQYIDVTLQKQKGKEYPWKEEDISMFSKEQEPEVILLEDEVEFDLGGRTVTCYLCPGHTPGSMVAVDDRTSYVFSGDCCNKFLGIGVRPIPGMKHASIEESYEAMKHIWNVGIDVKNIYSAHADFRKVGEPLEGYVFETVMEGLKKIVEGNYAAGKKWIQMIDTEVDIAFFEDIEIQFHVENIYGGEKAWT